MRFTHTHTVATLDVPQALYDHIASRLREAGYGHAFGEGGMIDMSGVGLIADPKLQLSDWHLNDRHKVAVSDVQFWQPMSTCPAGVSVQLLGPGGVPVYASWDGKDAQWLGWAPKPQVPEGLQPANWSGPFTREHPYRTPVVGSNDGIEGVYAR